MTSKARPAFIVVLAAAALTASASAARSGSGVPPGGERALVPCGQETAAPFTSQQKYLFDIIRSRRTVRDFRPDPVPKEHILKILDMARWAPTSGNQQPWKFLVVQDRDKLDLLKGRAVAWFLEDYEKRMKPAPEVLDQMRKQLPATMAKVLSAPVYVAVLTDSQSAYPPDNRYDGPLAAALLMIAARALGYGTGFYTTYFPEARMREFLGIPERYNLVCFTPIGVPAEWPPAPPKKPLEEFVVFEKF
ncbi:MAG TPA: nitroreductase family protein [Acidobacteriota bacterium]|nr:nitroreductase family protein [Acidobacteriota bacterium]